MPQPITKAGSSKPTTYIGGYSIVQAEDMDAVKTLLSAIHIS